MSLVHVAVGVILDADNRILITRRHTDAHQGGLWEFPGGKVEPNETLPIALARELKEELGIDVVSTRPLTNVRHDYGDKAVWLDVHVVPTFKGQAVGLEGQPLAWVAVEQLDDYRFPAANVPIVAAVKAYLSEL